MQPWTQVPFQRGEDLSQQATDPVRQPGRLAGQIVIEPDEHLQLGQHLFTDIDPAQCVRHRAGRVGDHVGIAGFGLRLARVQIGDAAHREPGQVGDLDAHRSGDRDGQRADRVRLIDHDQHPGHVRRVDRTVVPVGAGPGATRRRTP